MDVLTESIVREGRGERVDARGAFGERRDRFGDARGREGIVDRDGYVVVRLGESGAALGGARVVRRVDVIVILAAVEEVQKILLGVGKTPPVRLRAADADARRLHLGPEKCALVRAGARAFSSTAARTWGKAGLPERRMCPPFLLPATAPRPAAASAATAATAATASAASGRHGRERGEPRRARHGERSKHRARRAGGPRRR